MELYSRKNNEMRHVRRILPTSTPSYAIFWNLNLPLAKGFTNQKVVLSVTYLSMMGCKRAAQLHWTAKKKHKRRPFSTTEKTTGWGYRVQYVKSVHYNPIQEYTGFWLTQVMEEKHSTV